MYLRNIKYYNKLNSKYQKTNLNKQKIRYKMILKRVLKINK